MKKFALLTMSILIIMISGCVDDGAKTVPTQTPVATVTTEDITTVPTVTGTPLPEDSNSGVSEGENETIVDEDVNATIPDDTNETITDNTSGLSDNAEETDPDAQIYVIGDTVDDGNTRMTLNSMRYADSLSEKGPGYSVAKVNPGNKFLILNVTIENIGQGMNVSYDGSKFVVLDMGANSELIYEEDIVSSEGWLKHFSGNDIIPGDTRQGELAYQVPENAGELQLKFEYYSESSEGPAPEMFKLK